MSTYHRQDGFSLVDVLVAVSVATVLGAGAVTYMRSQSLAMRTEASQLDVSDEARGVVEFMAREIRMAGYHPRPPCAGSPFTAIVSGGPQQIRVQYDLNENGLLDAGPTASEDVTYQYNAGTQSIERVVGGVTTVLGTDVPADGFQLRYFPNTGAEIIGAGAGGTLTAAQAAAVFRVSILLQPSKQADSRVTTRTRAPLWTNVLLRNRQFPCV
jgi:type II secretory pathway component PulJ